MSTEPFPTECCVAPPAPRPDRHTVVRRPVLDAHGRVQAFELLGRPAADADGEPGVAASGLLDALGFYRLNRPSELKKLT
ncbi:MAG: hypothetical protein ACP5FH_11395, partial [Terracidiphilus sp.]